MRLDIDTVACIVERTSVSTCCPGFPLADGKHRETQMAGPTQRFVSGHFWLRAGKDQLQTRHITRTIAALFFTSLMAVQQSQSDWQ
jgi:hypothetical protein